jgi:uncharacterized membrane protein
MKDSKAIAIATAAVAGLFALTTLGLAGTAAAADKPEKCYGIVKAGKNDCQTSSHACAGQNKTDGEAMSWIYVPQGTCEKIVGGSLKPKA